MSAGDTGLKTGKFQSALLGLSSVKKARWGEHDQEKFFFFIRRFLPAARIQKWAGKTDMRPRGAQYSTFANAKESSVRKKNICEEHRPCK